MSTPPELNPFLPCNEESVGAVLDSISDPVVRNCVVAAAGVARMKFVRPLKMDPHEFAATRPTAPFDMTFFARIMVDFFSDKAAVRAMLDGATPEQASGWDI